MYAGSVYGCSVFKFLEVLSAFSSFLDGCLTAGCSTGCCQQQHLKAPSAKHAVSDAAAGLPGAQQRLALEPAARGTRKVVVATNIAETSLTIEVRKPHNRGAAAALAAAAQMAICRWQVVANNIRRGVTDNRGMQHRAGKAVAVAAAAWMAGGVA
jgi:hypothetical protein